MSIAWWTVQIAIHEKLNVEIRGVRCAEDLLCSYIVNGVSEHLFDIIGECAADATVRLLTTIVVMLVHELMILIRMRESHGRWLDFLIQNLACEEKRCRREKVSPVRHLHRLYRHWCTTHVVRCSPRTSREPCPYPRMHIEIADRCYWRSSGLFRNRTTRIIRKLSSLSRTFSS